MKEIEMPSETATVPVKSPWTSKINVVNVVTALISLAAGFGFVVPDEWKDTVLQLVGVLGPLLTVVLRTWFSTSVTSTSVK